jgi:hypothetical protein
MQSGIESRQVAGARESRAFYPTELCQFLELSLKERQIVMNDLPCNFEIQTEILMHDSIAQALYFSPGNIWMLRSEIARKLSRCFTKYSEVSSHGVNRLFILEEFRVV